MPRAAAVSGGLPEPAFPHRPELLTNDPLPGDGERHWTPHQIYHAVRGWAFPYLKSRVLPGDFHPIVAYLFTEYKCNLDCPICIVQNNHRYWMPMEDFERIIETPVYRDVAWRTIQMAAFVILTCFLFQKGSPESKDPNKDEPVDHDPNESRHDPDAPWPVRRGGWVLWMYSN